MPVMALEMLGFSATHSTLISLLHPHLPSNEPGRNAEDVQRVWRSCSKEYER